MRTCWFVMGIALAGCTDPSFGEPGDLDEPQDSTEAGDSKADGAACSVARCGDPTAANVLFPGNPACSGGGCERGLAGPELYVPPRNGKPWGDTYQLGTEAPVTLSGYSSGRIALLRRLALIGDGENAVLLDPSWPDGARDFAGRGPERGEDIVRAWLLDDPARTFTLVYSRRSIGWSNYAALATSEVGAQVKVCSVDQPHLLVPKIRGIGEVLIDPIAWDNGRCRWGAAP